MRPRPLEELSVDELYEYVKHECVIESFRGRSRSEWSKNKRPEYDSAQSSIDRLLYGTSGPAGLTLIGRFKAKGCSKRTAKKGGIVGTLLTYMMRVVLTRGHCECPCNRLFSWAGGGTTNMDRWDNDENYRLVDNVKIISPGCNREKGTMHGEEYVPHYHQQVAKHDGVVPWLTSKGGPRPWAAFPSKRALAALADHNWPGEPGFVHMDDVEIGGRKQLSTYLVELMPELRIGSGPGYRQRRLTLGALTDRIASHRTTTAQLQELIHILLENGYNFRPEEAELIGPILCLNEVKGRPGNVSPGLDSTTPPRAQLSRSLLTDGRPCS